MKTLVLMAAPFIVQIVNESGAILEPSVVNEVEHALSRAATNAPPFTAQCDIFGTNGLSAADVAITLVSRQNAKGEWIVNGTNATSEAAGILRSLIEPGVPERPPVIHNPENGDAAGGR